MASDISTRKFIDSATEKPDPVRGKVNGMPYSLPLDGIRAIAILAVMIFHVSPGLLAGGFAGVDVFFVLSGFLIASIILHDIGNRAFSFGEFYLRRIQRLVPNAVVTVLAVVILWRYLLPFAGDQTGRHALWTLGNLSNFYIWRNFGTYWGDAASWSPLLHTWSLAVEEQFYLIFPATLIVLLRFQRYRIKTWIVATALAGFALCLYGTWTHPIAAFYLLPTRIWEFLIGAALAVYRTPPGGSGQLSPGPVPQRLLEAAGLAGLGLIAVSFFAADEASGFPGVISLLPTVGTALVIWSAVDGRTQLARLLSTRLMAGTGKISYSLYLWHWPLIMLGRLEADLYGLPPLAGALVGAGASVLIAWLVHVSIEQPLRRRGPGRGRRLAVIGAAFSAAVAVIVAFSARPAMVDTSPWFDRPSFTGFQYNTSDADYFDQLRHSSRYRDVYFPPVADTPAGSWRTGGIRHLYGGGPPQVVVLGSSHALVYSRVIDDICRELGISVAFYGRDQMNAFFRTGTGKPASKIRNELEFYRIRESFLRQWQPAALVVIDRWDHYHGSLTRFDKDLRSFLSEVTPLAERVLFVSQVPVAPVGETFNLREYMAWRMLHGGTLPRLDPDENEADRRRIVELAGAAGQEFPNFRVLRTDQPFYHPDGSIRWFEGRTVFYADDDHLTDAGSEQLKEMFRRAIADPESRPIFMN